MSPDVPRPKNRINDSEKARYVQRRQFLALGAGMGAILVAGCTTETDPSDVDGGGTSSGASNEATAVAGTFRLLISDQPVAIGDFDELNVSFDRARIFRGEGASDDENDEDTDDGENGEDGDDDESGEDIEDEDGEDVDDDNNEGAEEDESDDEEQQPFFVIDLDGATVDLTLVVGEKAIGVFDGELPEGRYTKIELYVASVEGLVDGEPVDVTVPSDKLQIVKPFEVVAGEALTFVFDINVVQKGQTNEYNLLPVISESGVAGKDVEVDEIGYEKADADEDEDEEETEDEETAEDGDDEGSGNGEGEGPPDGAGENA